MKTFEITKEQILLLAEQHGWSESKLKQWFPKAFGIKLEVEKWYKFKGEESFLIYVCKEGRYGFDTLGRWFYDKNIVNDFDGNYYLATDKEVETALIAEAKSRGFKDGAVCLVGNFKRKTKLSESNFKLERNLLCVGADIIFNNGKWAEICEEPIELTLEQIAEKFNVNVEQLKIKK